MKFAIIVVILALAAAKVHSSAISYSAGLLPAPLSYTAVHGPSFYAPAAVPSFYSYAPSVYSAPAVVLAAAEGGYIAKTRGSIHTAPLPGHLNSVANINEEPAPGTL